MKKYLLSNGLTVIEKKRDSDSVAIQITIKVGSNSESEGRRGISHFIEHMLFEGTEKRHTAKEITNEIEIYGGEINAYTNNVKTCFYIKVPAKHFERAIDILSDILKNPLFRREDIEKEREIIIKEINMFNDESRFYQWIFFQSILFSRHPSRYPAYGIRKDVSKIRRDDILDYFNKYYTASNAIVSIVGDISNTRSIVAKYFGDMRSGEKITLTQFSDEPTIDTPIIRKVSKKTMNSYLVFGYKTVPRRHPHSYVIDVIQAILGRGQSGKIFEEIRSKRGLAYEVGVHHEASTDFGFFAVYLSVDKSNIQLVRKLILDILNQLDNITENEVRDAIGFVEGRYILDSEDTHNEADNVGYWELIEDARLGANYLDRIRKVCKDDISEVARKYFKDNNYAIAIIEQQD